MYPSKWVSGLIIAGLAVSLSACTAKSSNSSTASGDKPIEVKITDATCDLSANTVPSGTVKFVLKNNGTVRNEFEVLANDKLRIVGERENLGPGTTTEYTLTLEPGSYFTACKKNMVGALVGTKEFKVTDSGKKVEVNADQKKLQEEAVTSYLAYVRDQAGQLVEATKQFADAYKAGDTEKAKALYAPARMYYERIEPTAEQFGDIDPALDLREADWQEDPKKDENPWTGWHAIEKDLWKPADFKGYDKAQQTKLADQLVADTQKLYDYVYSKDFSLNLADISNGAIGLLEEVATSKITGEEEAFSHTDLWDFQANVEGAKVAFGIVENIAKAKNPELTKDINERFAALQEDLGKYKKGEGYEFYDKLDESQRKGLSDKVNALRKPLAQLTETILK